MSDEGFHADAGARCLVAHYEGAGATLAMPCIKCVCGEWVRPQHWLEHTSAPQPTPSEGQEGRLSGGERDIERIEQAIIHAGSACRSSAHKGFSTLQCHICNGSGTDPDDAKRIAELLALYRAALAL